jgi:hypothetical protein
LQTDFSRWRTTKTDLRTDSSRWMTTKGYL